VIALAAASSGSASAWDQPGTLGFLVVFGMSVALYFVFRSMSRHLRKVNQAARTEAEAAEKADGGVTMTSDAVKASPSRNESTPAH
jgi:uncharacterized protein with FMN-binding domain